ncbi:MAG: GNAT family N-acetyltransferase [Sulfitobacter sp.]
MIRDYTSDDNNQLVRIWKAANAVAHPFLPADFVQAEEANVRNIYPQFAEIHIIESNMTMRGFIAMLDDEIGGLFLDPVLHGQGLGRAMVDHVVAQKGPLRVQVFEKNTIGRRFYDRYGFSFTGRSVHDATGQVILHLAMPQAT